MLSLDLGTSVSLVGAIVKSLGKGQSYEFTVKEVKILGACPPEVRVQTQTWRVSDVLVGVPYSEEDAHDRIST